jgi:hypothetical protein
LINRSSVSTLGAYGRIGGLSLALYLFWKRTERVCLALYMVCLPILCQEYLYFDYGRDSLVVESHGFGHSFRALQLYHEPHSDTRLRILSYDSVRESVSQAGDYWGRIAFIIDR